MSQKSGERRKLTPDSLYYAAKARSYCKRFSPQPKDLFNTYYNYLTIIYFLDPDTNKLRPEKQSQETETVKN